MNKLLMESRDYGSGVYQEVTPEKAGWKMLSFRGRTMRKGEIWSGATEGNEYAIVLMGGEFSVRSSRGEWRIERGRFLIIGARPSLSLPDYLALGR